MLASFCPRFGDVQRFIFGARCGGRLTSVGGGRVTPGYPTYCYFGMPVCTRLQC